MGQSVLLEQKHSQLHLTGVQGGYSWTCRRRSRSSILCRAQLFSSVPMPVVPRVKPTSTIKTPTSHFMAEERTPAKNNNQHTFLADFRFTLNQMLRTKASTYWTTAVTETQQSFLQSKCHDALKHRSFNQFSSLKFSHVIWTYLYLRKILHMFPWSQPEPLHWWALDMSTSSCSENNKLRDCETFAETLPTSTEPFQNLNTFPLLHHIIHMLSQKKLLRTCFHTSFNLSHENVYKFFPIPIAPRFQGKRNSRAEAEPLSGCR